MVWERRGKKYYYYRSKRVNGRVVRVYFGSGPEAVEAARQDAEAQAQKVRNLEAAVQLEREVEEFFAMDDQMVAGPALRSSLTAAGYHKYRGVWRKKRKPKEGC